MSGTSPRLAQRLAGGLRSVAPALATFAEQVALLGGAGLIAFGAWQAYPPAGPIAGGVLLLAGAILRGVGKVRASGNAS